MSLIASKASNSLVSFQHVDTDWQSQLQCQSNQQTNRAKLYSDELNNTGVIPTGYNILVEIKESAEKRQYGSTLAIPDSAEERHQNAGVVGQVLQVGRGAYSLERYPEGPWVWPGDWVIIPPYAGIRLRSKVAAYAGSMLRLINEDTISAVILTPDAVERG